MMLCYLREEIDASPGDESELMAKAISAAESLVGYLDMSINAGDIDFSKSAWRAEKKGY
jgi:hypothetical protein